MNIHSLNILVNVDILENVIFEKMVLENYPGVLIGRLVGKFLMLRLNHLEKIWELQVELGKLVKKSLKKSMITLLQRIVCMNSFY